MYTVKNGDHTNIVSCVSSMTPPVSQTLKELFNDLMNDVPTGSADDSHYVTLVKHRPWTSIALAAETIGLGANSQIADC